MKKIIKALLNKQGKIGIKDVMHKRHPVSVKSNQFGGKNYKYKAIPGQYSYAITRDSKIILDKIEYFSIHEGIPAFEVTFDDDTSVTVSPIDSIIIMYKGHWRRANLMVTDVIGEFVPGMFNNQLIEKKIVDVKPLGTTITMYDLSMENTTTFLSANGVFIYDTLTVHTPVTPESVEEVNRMMPSKNIISEEITGIKTTPDHASAAGLYLLSKTPEGRKRINNIIPAEYKITSPTNKKEWSNILYNMARAKKTNMNKVLSDLRREGDKEAYEKGITLGLQDLKVIKPLKDKILKLYREKVPMPEIAKQIEKDIPHYLGEGNNLKIMLDSKARGSASQFRDMLVSPITVHGSEDREKPIMHSYTEGLAPEEYWDASKGARSGVLGRSQKTALPGALGKEILYTTNTLVLNGVKGNHLKSINFPITSNIDDLIDRILAENIVDDKGMILQHKDTPVNSHTIQMAKKNGYKTIAVYTPLGSSNSDGSLPIFSYGLKKTGDYPEDGYNAGAKSTFGIIEPLFSSSMKSFHTGGAITDKETGYPRLKQLFELTGASDKNKKLPKEATLALSSGTVTNIKADELGGHKVFVGTSDYYVSPLNKVTVKVGDKITKGDALSNGPIQPKDLASLKSLQDAQNYIVDEIRENVPNIRRRAAEVMVEGLTRHAKIIDSGDTDYIKGDVDLVNSIEEKNNYSKNPATYEYLFKGVNTLPQATQSWLSQLGFRNLKRTFANATTEMKESDTHAYEPIPAMAYSKDFGKGDKGKY